MTIYAAALIFFPWSRIFRLVHIDGHVLVNRSHGLQAKSEQSFDVVRAAGKKFPD